MAKRLIIYQNVVHDMRSGMDDPGLMEKYDISAEDLPGLFERMLKTGVIDLSELEGRTTILPLQDDTPEGRSGSGDGSPIRQGSTKQTREKKKHRSKAFRTILGVSLLLALCAGMLYEPDYPGYGFGISRLFMDLYPTTDVADQDGITSLMRASLHGDFETVKWLLDKGANANAKDKDGETSLMAAAVKGHAEVVTLLIANGADVNAESKSGRTALNLARQFSHHHVARMLSEAGATK